MRDLHLIWAAELVDSEEADAVFSRLYQDMDGRKFARFQLSRLHSLIKNETGIVIRYDYDDWHLYMQYVIAAWIYKSKHRKDDGLKTINSDRSEP